MKVCAVNPGWRSEPAKHNDEKMLDCADAVAELRENLAQLYEDNFTNIQTKFDNDIALLEHLTNTFNTGIDALEAQGYMESKVYYDEQWRNRRRFRIVVNGCHIIR